LSGLLGRAFDAARAERRGAFLPYLTSGYPSPEESDRLALALCEEGVDALELGVPFSDPLADGPVIQRATQAALAQGTTLAHVLGQALRLRARHPTPLILMSYLNPVVRYGAERFATDAREAGVDGVILVDLPPEEEPVLWDTLQGEGLDTIALVAPTTEPSRLSTIASRARGFLYVVARLGVTGTGSQDADLSGLLERCRGVSPLPRCLGFGIDAKTDLTRYRGLAEGVVVGSALLGELLSAGDAASREARARTLARAIRAKLGDLGPGLSTPSS
jgi:tryptophan synthase alpha chain